MQLTYHKIDVGAATAELYDQVTKAPADVWKVAFSPLYMDQQIDWRITVKGELVHIPLFSYLAPDRPTDLIGYAAQLGVRAMHDMLGETVQRLHLSIGEPVNCVTDNGEESLQFYMGVGILRG